eukprot:CAMPEP_0204081430 /NCGR_PEP_ID=MMETSP0360-20130528/175522_1 /ASSEMBLY_ACC=CAM_ASM_000342 /TAXON_ID=268821 /ORGANISM="Scrippsiella Hangoei, Strain SHTV-5" /LENGTH=69 /DNA_ID=CAMNT_0051030255 /DNA_START=149 /DNA_END=358 /DNA_ORIENTATION=+
MSASKVMASSSLEEALFMESAFVGGAQPQSGSDATTCGLGIRHSGCGQSRRPRTSQWLGSCTACSNPPT